MDDHDGVNPGAIDDVTVESDGSVTMRLVQAWEWDGSDHLLLLVQEKLFNYLAFIADGELARAYPGQRRWGVAVDCRSEPDRRTDELLQTAADQFSALGGTRVVRLLHG
jgi:hypothetical protein